MVVRGIDQRLQLVRRAVGGIGRIRQHAVIAPVALTREIVDRHQFDRGDAECRQPRKLPRHTAEAAEDSGMEFVQHGLAPRPSAPGGVAPRVAARIDHDAWIVHVVRLRPRRGIRAPAFRPPDDSDTAFRPGTARSLSNHPSGERVIGRIGPPSTRHAHGLLRGRPQAKLASRPFPRRSWRRSGSFIRDARRTAGPHCARPHAPRLPPQGDRAPPARRCRAARGAGRCGIGSRKSHGRSSGLSSKVRIVTFPSGTRIDRRKINVRCSMSFHASTGIVSPDWSNQAMSAIPGAGYALPCRKFGWRSTGCSRRSAISRAT